MQMCGLISTSFNYQAKSYLIQVVKALIYRREVVQDVMQINVEMKCNLA